MKRRRWWHSLGAAVRGLYRGIDGTRRLAVNLLFVVIVLFLLALYLDDGRVDFESGAALRVAPAGLLVEELTGDPGEQALLELVGQGVGPETLMRDLLDAIELARDDDDIGALVLDLNGLAGGQLSKLQELRAALVDFKTSGKKVIAVSDFYLQSDFHLAAAADEVLLHPMGMVLLSGYGSYRNYYKDAIDLVEAQWNVFRVGEYKSSPEPYLRNDMSPEAREARARWLGQLWDAYRADIAAARDVAPAALDDYVDNLHLRLAESDGDGARLALETGLVDRLAARDEVRSRLIELVGEDDAGSYRSIDSGAYLRGRERIRKGDERVAVVVAKGTILDGFQPRGTIGGESTARLLRSAREDDSVKAIVLRVDSGGGSAFASEIIRREIELAREEGKPVVASMGSVAASGGYWISMSADEIWASPTTITGSIGIYAIVPTFEKTLLKVGIHTDGVSTAEWAGEVRPDMDLPPEAGQAIQLMLEASYRDFVGKASAARGLSFEELDSIARGRVWAGAEALELGLVDKLGGLEEAIAAAAERAGLDDDYGVTWVEPTRGAGDRLLERLFAGAGRFLPAGGASGWLPGWLRGQAHQAAAAGVFERPFTLWAHCSCTLEEEYR